MKSMWWKQQENVMSGVKEAVAETLAEKQKLAKEEEDHRECRKTLEEQADKLKDSKNQGSADHKEAIRQALAAREDHKTLIWMKQELSRVTALFYASIIRFANSEKESLDLIGTRATIKSSGDKDAADDAA